MDINILNKYYDEGLLIKQIHPTHPLTIWNYSPKVQYENLWDEITEQCRGLVTDDNGKVIARPFKKFWNLEEHSIEDLPVESFSVTEKMDGSLIIGFFFKTDFILATRGSFTSVQSNDAYRILFDEMGINPHKLFIVGYTYLFEYIAPHNRIVVNYGNDRKLLPLGIVHTFSGDEYSHGEMLNFYNSTGFEVVKIYDGIEDYKKLKGQIDDNAEGFVIRFKSGFRVKVKGEEYVRLHKIVTNVSNRTIWEYLSEGKNFDELLDRVPDEFYKWVKSTKRNLINQYEFIEIEYMSVYRYIKRSSNIEDRKVFAEYAKGYKYPSILFNMYDNKDYSKMIWGMIKPKYEKPFSTNGSIVE